MKRTTALLALLILVATTAVALAQPQRGERPWRKHKNPREMTEAFRLYKLTEVLELNEEQTAKLFPRMAEANKARETHRDAMQERMKKLRGLVDAEKWSEAADLAEEIHAKKAEHMAAMQKNRADMTKLLSDEQRAKLMLFEHRWGMHLKSVGEKMKRSKAPRGQAGHGSGCQCPGCDGEGPRGPRSAPDTDTPHGPRGGW